MPKYGFKERNNSKDGYKKWKKVFRNSRAKKISLQPNSQTKNIRNSHYHITQKNLVNFMKRIQIKTLLMLDKTISDIQAIMQHDFPSTSLIRKVQNMEFTLEGLLPKISPGTERIFKKKTVKKVVRNAKKGLSLHQ